MKVARGCSQMVEAGGSGEQSGRRSVVFGGYRGGVTFHGSKLAGKAFGAIKLRLDTSNPSNFSRHILPPVPPGRLSASQGLISPYCDSWPAQTPQPPPTPTLFAVGVNTGDGAGWPVGESHPSRTIKGCAVWGRGRGPSVAFIARKRDPLRWGRGTLRTEILVGGRAAPNIDNFGCCSEMDTDFCGRVDLQGDVAVGS